MKKLKVLLAAMAIVAGITACTVPEVVTTPTGETITNQVVDPKVVAAIETAKALNAASAPVNPYAPLVTGVLGTSTAVFGLWGTLATLFANRNKKMLVATVKGVEKAGEGKVKEAIAVEAAAIGVASDLHAVVKATT